MRFEAKSAGGFLLCAAAALVALLMVGTGHAQRNAPLAGNPPDPHPGATQPVREQNVDANGWIAVHEQGVADVYVTNAELDVNITNSTLDVTGTVSVDNFPETQDVFVTGGSVETIVPEATAAETLFPSTPAGDTEVFSIPLVNATAIALWDSSVTGGNDPEMHLKILSPLTGGTLIQFSYDDGLTGALDLRTFPYPVPVNGVELWCKNESDNCTVGIAIIGN